MAPHPSSTTSGDSDALASRYGKPLVPKRTAKVLTIVGAVVFLAVLTFVGVRFADQPVTAKTVGFEHVDDDTVTLNFQLTRRPGQEVTCTVQALNEGRAQVGFREIDVPAGSQRQLVTSVDIDTQGKAVSAEVIGCKPA